MPSLLIEYVTDADRLALEQAVAFVNQMRQLAQDAPAGGVLAACEAAALTDGRALLRSTLAAALQRRVDADERKGGQPASARGRTPGATRAATPARS